MKKAEGVYRIFQHEDNAICECGGLPYVSAIWLEISATGGVHLMVEEKCYDCEGYLDLTDYTLPETSVNNPEEK